MNVAENDEKRSVIWGNVHVCNIGIGDIHGEELLRQLAFHQEYKDLTMKPMFNISARLVSEHDEISGLETIGWEDYSGKYLSLIGDERVISLQPTKVYVLSDSVLYLGKIHENQQSNAAWEQRLEWFKTSQEYRNLDKNTSFGILVWCGFPIVVYAGTQSVIATSSPEIEYHGACAACAEALHVQSFIFFFGFTTVPLEPHLDASSAIAAGSRIGGVRV